MSFLCSVAIPSFHNQLRPQYSAFRAVNIASICCSIVNAFRKKLAPNTSFPDFFLPVCYPF